MTDKKQFKQLAPMIVLLVVSLGILLLFVARAGVESLSIEAESATGTNVSVVDDETSSNGSYLEFSGRNQVTKAMYELTYNFTWDETTHPTTIPAGFHFSPPIAVIHGQPDNIFAVGELATDGVQDVAETGKTDTIASEIDGLGDAVSDHSIINLSSRKRIQLQATSDHPYFSFLTMLAPSPDWFVGTSGYSLVDTEGKWLDTVTIDLSAFDAGTDSGEDFTSDNIVTDPQKTISEPLEEAFKAAAREGSFGSITLTRIKEAPQIKTITGVVREIQPDCGARTYLNQNDEVVTDDGPIICDAGTFVKINNTRVQTASGFVPAELAFNKHPEGLKLGDTVTTLAVPNEYVTGEYTLDCEVCTMEIINTSDVKIITGIVREIHLDCNPRTYLNEDNEVVIDDGPILCDAGTFVKVNDTRIQTASGFVPAELAFDKHPEGLKLGDEVTAFAAANEFAPGEFTLNCDKCRMVVLGINVPTNR